MRFLVGQQIQNFRPCYLIRPLYSITYHFVVHSKTANRIGWNFNEGLQGPTSAIYHHLGDAYLKDLPFLFPFSQRRARHTYLSLPFFFYRLIIRLEASRCALSTLPARQISASTLPRLIPMAQHTHFLTHRDPSRCLIPPSKKHRT